MATPRSAGPDLLALGDIVLDTTPAPALGQFIAGRWDGARSGARRDVIEPATSRVLATLPDSGPEDLEVALAAARAAQREWAALTVGDR
jgi:acyl-CoA reductase-like NAD-dependent aldehyde dehydrogenase